MILADGLWYCLKVRASLLFVIINEGRDSLLGSTICIVAEREKIPCYEARKHGNAMLSAGNPCLQSPPGREGRIEQEERARKRKRARNPAERAQEKGKSGEENMAPRQYSPRELVVVAALVGLVGLVLLLPLVGLVISSVAGAPE